MTDSDDPLTPTPAELAEPDVEVPAEDELGPPEGPVPLEAEPADVAEQQVDVPGDDDDYREA